MSFTQQLLQPNAFISTAQNNLGPTGGGRHLVLGDDGIFYLAFVDLNGSGDARLRVMGFTVNAQNEITEEFNEVVYNFGAVYVQAFAIDLDQSGSAVERVLVAFTALGDPKIHFSYLDTSSPGSGFTSGDDFNHGIGAVPQWATTHAFQILGRTNGVGNINIVYEAKQPNSGGSSSLIKHRTLSGLASTWSGATNIDASSVPPANEEVGVKCLSACKLVGGADEIELVFGRRRTSSPFEHDLYYSRFSGTWSTPAVFYTSETYLPNQLTTHEIAWVDVVCDSQGRTHVVWFSGSHATGGVSNQSSLFWNRKASGGAWLGEERFAIRPATGSNTLLLQMRPSLGCDQSDEPYVVWTGEGFGAQVGFFNPCYATRATGSWVTSTPILSEASHYFLAAVPHSLRGDSLLHTLATPALATIAGRPLSDEDVYLFTSDDWSAYLRRNASVALSMSAVGAEASIKTFPKIQLTMTASAFSNQKAEVPFTMTVDGRRVYDEAQVITLLLSPSAAHIYTPPALGIVALSLSSAVGKNVLVKDKGLVFLSMATAVLTGDIAAFGFSMSVAAGKSGITQKSGSVGLSMSATGLAAIGEACETAYDPDPALPSTADSVVLVVWSCVAANVAMVIRRPNTGDSRNAKNTEELHRRRDGGRVIYSGKVVKEHELRWTDLTRRQLLEFENFLRRSAGLEVRYRDHNNHTWAGRVTNYPHSFVTGGREQGSVEIVFEGSLVVV